MNNFFSKDNLDGVDPEEFRKSLEQDETREYLDVIFEGECKDINTFRYINKLLKIN